MPFSKQMTSTMHVQDLVHYAEFDPEAAAELKRRATGPRLVDELESCGFNAQRELFSDPFEDDDGEFVAVSQ